MPVQDLVGRRKEAAILEKYYASDKSEFVAVYGRRRVGKTYLVQKIMGDRFDYDFSGLYGTQAKAQRQRFQKALDRRTGSTGQEPANWFDAFDNLKDYLLSLGKERVVVFLDELPWLDTQKSNFLVALSDFWNGWHNGKTLLKLYVCGSATTWMVNRLIGDPGGLYGRISRSIYLAPFSLRETGEYLNQIKGMNYGNRKILDAYMIFGGIPYYLDMLDGDLPLSVNVDNLMFAEGAPLRTEYEFLFRSLFRDSSSYRKVVELLSQTLSGLTRLDIVRGTGLTGGELSKVLDNLKSCDFIRSYTAPRNKIRNQLYQLTDMFALFHLRFVSSSSGQDEHYWTKNSETGKKNAWAGYAFEQVCLHHLAQIKQKLGISGMLSQAYAWSMKPYTDADGSHWKGAQIDLIIDRSDNVQNLCEMKYCNDEFVIDKDYAETVRARMESYRRHEKCRKDLRCTFITLSGVKSNMYSSIVDNQIRLDDLFAE